jgi:hypothetical protein
LAFGTTAMVTGGGRTILGGDPVPSSGAAPVDHLTAYQVGPHIWIRDNNELLTSYRAHPTQKYPYFYPLIGPTSKRSLTTETSQPWPHHRSLLFACDKVNGGNYWQGTLPQGRILSQDARLGDCTPSSAEILDTCLWKQDGKEPIIRDTRRFTVSLPETQPDLYMIDATITLEALVDITIQKTNHSLFAIRAAGDLTPDGGGVLENSEGAKGSEAIFGQPAKWCTFYGRRNAPDGRKITEGIALMALDEPFNNCPWFTRDYGFMSPTPFNFLKEPWRLPEGKSVTMNYRVVAYTGTPREAGLEEIWLAFANQNA